MEFKVDGKYFVEGKNITGFTVEEEKELGFQKIIPYLMEE